MTKFFKSAEWDDYWGSSKRKMKGFNRVIDHFRTYFGNQYVRTLKKICSGSIGKILEVGCGTAYCSQQLSRVASGSYALDYSEKAKIFWVDNSVNYLIADGLSIPFMSNTFDVVWNAGVLEHFSNPRDMLKEMIRVCKPGGFVCVFVPYIFDFTAHLKLYGNENIFTRKKLKEALEDLQNIKVNVLYSLGAMIVCGFGKKRMDTEL